MKRNLLAILLSLGLILFFTSVTYSFTPGSVEITVKDYYSGALLEGADVKIEPGGHAGITSSGGTLTLTGIIPYRNYAVEVSLEGYIHGLYGAGRTAFVSVQTGQTTPVTVPLKKKASITGQVTFGVWPIAGAWVVLLHRPIMASDVDLLHIARTQTNASGNYEFEPIPSGDYIIRAVADSFYQASDNLTIGADDSVTHNFSITPGSSSLTYSLVASNDLYGKNTILNSVGLKMGTDYTDRYIDVIDMPPGGDFKFDETLTQAFTAMGPGAYTVAMMIVDLNGVGLGEESLTIEMLNHATESYPTIIPGPSELPLLYSSTVYATSSGTSNVTAGNDVYLRGWGRDINLGSPEMFNPGAPMFDIYGNKNGDWSQSAFSFEWSLRDGSAVDQTALLSSTSSENVHFTVPAGAQNGDSYIATLTVTGDGALAGDPAEVSVVVAGSIGNTSCGFCHGTNASTYQSTTHATENVNCETCHGPASTHNGDPEKISKTHWSGNCGRCHEQFAQWQKSRHSDPLAFGHGEISPALLPTCYKCHYTEGFIGAVESGENFSDFKYPMIVTDVPKDTPNISCDVCHDPHVQSVSNPAGIRTGSEASLCGTCHKEKWQNATYTATGGEIGNAYHWPETDYTQYQGAGNPHQMTKGCVTCHMAKDITDTDSYGVRKVGAHSLRMRDIGPDGDPDTADDLLNIAVCQTCHSGLTTFDRNGTKTSMKNKLDTLGNLLKVNNHEYLPPFQPGKCATCHRGGSLPFINDTETKTLENAYLNYKLILHDRSFGVHNPGYIERLLDDSISALSDSDYDGINDLEDNCPSICNFSQLDADGDGIGDVCDDTTGCDGCSSICEQICIVDSDGDGIADGDDNCINNCNSQQLDADNDGMGDVCDPDDGCFSCGGDPICETEC